MKKILLAIVPFLMALTSFSQAFEGKISYQNTYTTKDAKLTDEQLISMMGSKSEYLIKDGNYKNTSNGKLIQWQLYINQENKLYTKMSNSAAAFWNDASVQGDSVLKVEVNKNVTEVLGYKCDEVILTCKSGIQKYYFNSIVSVNVSLFEKHLLGNWYDYISKAKALPLKSIIETPLFIVETTATEIKAMKIENNTFELPKGMSAIKSPY